MNSEEMSTARKAALAAGSVLTRYFREGIVMRTKDVANLVSDADIEAERAIVATIRDTFPTHEVLGEEEHTGDVGAEHLWVVDPLDGTNNFAHRIPHFAVSIAYYRAGEPVCGVIYNPIRDDWYESVRGAGAFANGAPARVAEHTRLDETLIGVGFYYERGALMDATLEAVRDLKQRQIHGMRRFGTASLDFSMVGAGMIGAYFELTLSPWDFAAGRLFVEEAGGRVTTCRGEPLPLAKSSVLVTNGALHDTVLEIVRAHLPT
jgi:myo-inositol-1(or 4)-monophosphatase